MAIEKFRTRLFSVSNLTVNGNLAVTGTTAHTGATTFSGTVNLNYGTTVPTMASNGAFQVTHIGGGGGTARLYFRANGTTYAINLVANGSVTWAGT